MATKKTSIGGQALMEGIMMRGPKKTAMAVRTNKGEIILEDWENDNKVPAICKLPIIRGVYGMVTSFMVGYKCLMRSSEIALEGIEEEERAAEAEKRAAEAAEKSCASADAQCAEQTEEAPSPESKKATEKPESDEKGKKEDKKGSDTLMTVLMTVFSVIGILLMIGLFFFLPSLIYDLTLKKLLPIEGYLSIVVRSVFEGILKIILMVVYMLLVSLMKDIRRTFMYHGAEHKTIFCYEQGLPLTVENIRPMRRFHPRCGTSFLILMLLVGIVVGAFVPFEHRLLRTACRLLLLPLTVGIGYELIKLAGRHDNLFTRIISAPGVWLQHITTKEPTDDMIECAIAAMNKVIPENAEEDNW